MCSLGMMSTMPNCNSPSNSKDNYWLYRQMPVFSPPFSTTSCICVALNLKSLLSCHSLPRWRHHSGSLTALPSASPCPRSLASRSTLWALSTKTASVASSASMRNLKLSYGCTLSANPIAVFSLRSLPAFTRTWRSNICTSCWAVWSGKGRGTPT